jgi:ubiquinone/menaquinone biosynthesis C-methylase UbiE
MTSNGKDDRATITAHYDRPRLSDHIFGALEKAGKRIDSYRDAMGFDQFHMRGVEATRELAALAGAGPGQHVLDLGCGLGGAGRLLAVEFGCRVTGIDLAPGFIDAARDLTQAAGLEDRVSFQTGDLCALPFDDAQFDLAWSQHTLMNIRDKADLFAQIARVLKAGGRFAFYEVLAGPRQPVHYPVQWAGDASINFLLPEERLRALLAEAGFAMRHWQEVSDLCQEWFRQTVAKMDRRPSNAPPPLGLNLVIGPTAAEKARNTLRNLEEERIRVVYGVVCKQDAR